MHEVPLGPVLLVSALGIGALPLSGAYGRIDEGAALRLLRHGLDCGSTFIDTADVYGDGRNEILVGRAIVGRRDEVRVATKFGLRVGAPGVNGSPSAVRPAVQGSLRRLGVERIDLLYLHRVDPTVPIEDTVGAMAQLVSEGLVANLGLSEATGPEVRRAVAVHAIAAVQSEWSVWSRDVERDVVPTASEVGAGFVASSPLGRGFLAGVVGVPDSADERSRMPRQMGMARAANLNITATIRGQAVGLGATPAQVAIAWLRQTAARVGLPVVPIPGTRSIKHFDENLAALNLVLPDDVVKLLDSLAARVVGPRGAHPEWLSVGRETSPNGR